MDASAVYRGADLIFEPEAHRYSLPNGRVIPSVTQILKETGISVDFDELTAKSAWLGERIEFRRALGTAVHADCHAFDDADLDWSQVDERVRPYVDAWTVWRANTMATPITRERRLYDPIGDFAGTLDGIFAIGHKRVLVDIKIGDPEDAGCRYQTAAYEAAFLHEHMSALTIDERWAVRLMPERRVPYLVTNYNRQRLDSWRDFAAFQAFATTYRCQAVRRTAA